MPKRRKKVEAVIIHSPALEPQALTGVPVFGDPIRVWILPLSGDRAPNVEGTYIGIQDGILWFEEAESGVTGIPLLRIDSIVKL